ncbi:MAG: KH domain-containing protein [Clostridia bacterium]
MPVGELIEYLARSLVDDPDSVEVKEVAGERSAVLEISVAEDDIGKIIGRNGRIVGAIRTVAKAAAAKEGRRVEVEILE